VSANIFKNDFYKHCQSKQPGFALKTENISILRQPKAFYETLLKMIARARKRIYISSLYIGAEETELVNPTQGVLASK
jgi:CDP-diacylglycerol--glycerol-3-phosphate 3-phosphatidyltransferase